MTYTLYLSVTKTGVVSLWDSKRQAQSVTDEAFVELMLSPEQVVKIRQAQRAAGRKP
jgi:hypothetical protein